jgi:RND superfamily putative drug exporter
MAQRRPKTIIGLWLLLVIGCVAGGSLVGSESLTPTQSEVGQSANADVLLHRAGLTDPAVESILVTSPSASLTSQATVQLTSRLAGLAQVASVRGPAQQAPLSTDGGRIVLVQAVLAGDPDAAADHVGPVEVAVAAVQHAQPGARLQEEGDGSGNKAINDLITQDLSRAEKISLPITLAILVLAFGALVAASVPLLLGLTSVAAALGALGVVSHLVPNSSSTSAVVVLIGLAVGIDYSLFYVRREREERRRGRPEARSRHLSRGGCGEDVEGGVAGVCSAAAVAETSALEAAAASVGRAILVSGLTVMMALAGLLVTGQGDFISIGLGTIVVVLIAVVGSLTVLPAVLALLGDGVDRAQVPGYSRLLARRIRRDAAAGRRSGPWAALARGVTAHPGASLTTAGCVLATLAVPLFGMRTAALGIADLPPNMPVVQAAHAIERAFPGAPQAAELVVKGRDLGAARAHQALVLMGERAVRMTGGKGELTLAVSADGRLARVDVPMPDRSDDSAKAAVLRLRSQVAPTAARVPGAYGHALVTGNAASGVDYSARMATATPEVIGFVLALGFLLLLVTFQAPLLAAAMMLLNLLSIGAAYGILTAVFQHTWAEHVLGFHSTGHIINWLPLFLFVILFGLSMDYTVLVLERIRESRLSGLGPRQASAEGVAATGGTVTSAAIVMVAVFSVFATLDVINFKQLGVGLGAAVLLDATLVRGVALPATVALLGERGWPVRRPPSGAAQEGLTAGMPCDDEVVLAGQVSGQT